MRNRGSVQTALSHRVALRAYVALTECQPELNMLIWRLNHAHYAPAACHLRTERFEPLKWQLTVYRGAEVFMAETHTSTTLAWQRSTEIWQVMHELGWNELRH